MEYKVEISENLYDSIAGMQFTGIKNISLNLKENIESMKEKLTNVDLTDIACAIDDLITITDKDPNIWWISYSLKDKEKVLKIIQDEWVLDADLDVIRGLINKAISKQHYIVFNDKDTAMLWKLTHTGV